MCAQRPECCLGDWWLDCYADASELCCDLCSENTANCENSDHVVTSISIDESAILDGFTITAGNANRPVPTPGGGGRFNDVGSPTVPNCTFSGNSSSWAGG